MKIKERLRLNTWIFMGAIVLMMVTLAWSFREVYRADRNVVLTDEMRKVVFERIFLRDDYLLNPSEKAKIKWYAKTETLRVLLESGSERFTDTEDRALLQKALKNLDATFSSFSVILEEHGQNEYADRKKLAFSEADSTRIGQTFLDAYALNDNIVKLHESSRRAATAARNSGVISIILFVVGSIIAIVVNSIFISRLVAKRITALHEGVKIIGDGNLDYHIAAVGDDELSDLARASNEMVTKLRASQEYSESVINTVREPLISLDQDLRVVTVSRSFCEFFKVKPEDTVGQLIYDLGNKQWDIPKLRELLETILPQKSTFDNYEVEHDFTTIGKRTMLLNARQIQRASGKERIILLAIDDITEHKKAQQAIEEARVYAENIVETIQEPLIVLDTDLKVISANSAFYQTFKVNHKETEGQFIYDLGNRQWNIPRLRQLLEDVLPRNSAFDNYEIEHDFETIGPKTMLFNARRLDSVQMILITIYDITERKRAEEKLQKNEEQFIERKKIEIELKEANEQLIKFNDLKDEFVSIASHELRTPLSIISGAVKLLIDEIPGKIASGQKEILDMAMRNLDRLARIVDALLSISKIESGKTELYRTDADICRLITETVDEYNLPAGKKHINLSCQLPAHPVILHADADRIKEVISNLLSNSLKFTPEGGSINVCCEDRNDDVFVFVKDTGCGVAKNDVPRLFEKFTQFNRKVGPGEKGTGLGLAICKGLVNLHNGKIWAESDTGSGMKVSFTIPRLSAEYIFTESVDNAVTSSLKTGGGAAVVLVSTKPVIQIDSPQMQAILKDVSGVLERNLRRNAHDTVIQNTKEVLVVLENCDIVEAAAVCQRLTQAIECHLADKDLSSKLDLLIGYAAYPDDGQTGQSLIEKAREAGVACLPSNKA